LEARRSIEKQMTPELSRNSRLLLFAPHPDDESLACGILLQRAVEAGAAICMVYITDGENNPWPQRYLSRCWRLNAADRQRWAKLRRRETLAALRMLGVSPEDARFLSWPDQGLGRLFQSDSALVLARLRYLILEWSPSDVIGPDMADRHTDHRAVGSMLNTLFAHRTPALENVRRWSYIVHGRDARFLCDCAVVPQTLSQGETKRRAIGCHQTQLMLSRRRFLSYAARPELLRLVLDGNSKSEISKSETNTNHRMTEIDPAFERISP
jgi:LmbE family N-acetylglucosaminyl deacetylase